MSQLIFTEIPLMGAEVGPENPMPDLKNVSYIHATFQTTEWVTETDRKYFGVGKIDTLLPYLSQDNYTRERRMRNYNAVILENEFLRAVFLPDFGGRLWSLVHKPTGRELLYKNEIVQPCNLALRNAWIAGGVEWNVGIKGHTPFTCAPLFVAEGKNGKGEPILTMYEYERIRGTVFGINFGVPTYVAPLPVSVAGEVNSRLTDLLAWYGLSQRWIASAGEAENIDPGQPLTGLDELREARRADAIRTLRAMLN